MLLTNMTIVVIIKVQKGKEISKGKGGRKNDSPDLFNPRQNNLLRKGEKSDEQLRFPGRKQNTKFFVGETNR